MANPNEKKLVPTAEERKRMLLELRDHNDFLTPKKIAYLSGISIRTAESYLWDTQRYPDMFCLFACFSHVRYNHGPHSTELRRHCTRFESRWIRKGGYHSTESKIYGDNLRDCRKYIYRGCLLSIADIARISKKNFHSTYARIRKDGLEAGDDVTDCVESVRKKGRKKLINNEEQ